MAWRAGQVVSKLLSIARKKSILLVPTDLNDVVSETVELLGPARLDRNLNVQVQLAPHLPIINGDKINLEQVIANLVMNAMDAMQKGGTITITTAIKEPGTDGPAVHPNPAPGGYVVLTVTDSASGISREVLDKVFVPFFTTKS